MPLTKQQICDSKVKHTELSAQYIISLPENGIDQDYYKCDVCGQFHVTVKNKSVAKKRSVRLIERETHLAKQQKKKREGFKKKRR